MTDLPAREALAEVARVRRSVRSRRWWYVAAGIVMALFLTAYYIAMAAWPDDVGDYVLPAVLAVGAILGLMTWRTRSLPRGAARLENRVLGASLGLAVVTMLVSALVLPEGFSVWIVLTGMLPGLPYLYLAWRVGRR